MKKIISLILTLAVAFPFVITASAVSVAENRYSELTDFAVYNSSSAVPAKNDAGIVTPAGVLKMPALDGEVGKAQKTFSDFYNKDNYDFYGNSYTLANYRAVFSDNDITTGDSQSKLKLDGTSAVTDFDIDFTVQKISQKSLYAGVAFRLQDEDFRNAAFGTQGYMIFVNSTTTGKDVKIQFRRYFAADDYAQTTNTATGLLTAPLNAVKVNVTVTGSTANVTVCDAATPENSYTAKFALRPDAKLYFDRGSVAFVANGDHKFSNISLNATIETGYTEQKMPIYDLLNHDRYDFYGNGGTVDNDYGTVFTEELISVAGQSKVKLKDYSNTENFEASFSVTKTNGNALYGGLAFHVQQCGFKAGTFGGPGYLLYAYSAADSMDVSVILRNYLTATSYVQTTVATVEGLLAAPADGVYITVKVRDGMLNFKFADTLDRERVSDEYSVSLYNSGAKAGNYKGGAIALVANGTHDYTELSVTRVITERSYKQVGNFSAHADIVLPDTATVQQGLTFYTQKAANVSPGLEGYGLILIRTANSAANAVTVQLVRYGTDADGGKMVNLGAIATDHIAGFLNSTNGAGEKLRLNITAIRGRVEYSVQNLTNGKQSDKFTVMLNAPSVKASVKYTALYKSGYIGYFTNGSKAVLSDLTVSDLADITLSFGESTGGSLKGDGVYSYGETVTVKAKADPNYYFAGWYSGGELLSGEEEYSFTIEEDTVISPLFKLFPIRVGDIDTDGGYATVTVDERTNTEKIGFSVTVKNENGETFAEEDTEYIKQQSTDRVPFIITDKVYYCDVSNDGVIDSGDIVSLRRYLFTGKGNINTAAADLNADGDIDIRDIVRIKRVFAEPDRKTDIPEGDNTYPFEIGKYVNGGKQYFELKPYAVVEGIKTYGAAKYLVYSGGQLVNDSISPAHTPFAPVKIACVGDSITQGVGATGWGSGNYNRAYPEQMQGILGDGAEVGNFGKGGSYVYYYSGRNAALWYPNTAEYAKSNGFDADIVIIKLGTNDARTMTGDATAKAWSEQFDALIKHYKSFANAPKIYVVSCITMKLYNKEYEQKLVEYILPCQKEIAESNGCEYIDAYNGLYDYFTGGTGFASDGLHPNDEGYRALAKYIADRLDTDIYF